MVNIQAKSVRLIGLNRKVYVTSSKKPLATKLFIKEHYRIMLVNAPDDYQSLLGPLPNGVNITTEVSPDADFIQVFFMNRDEMEKQLFLPPFQQSLAHILFGKGLECPIIIEKVNEELSPLGIKLHCPE